MAVRLSRASRGAGEADLRGLEAKVGTRLPEDYRRFLLQHDGGEPEPNEFAIPGADNDSGANEFMSVRQIREEIEQYSHRFPRRMIPIAFAEGGNLVFLALDDGQVLFWDHELEAANPLFALAPSFEAFWQVLENSDPASVELDPDQVKSVWIDPDLLT